MSQQTIVTTDHNGTLQRLNLPGAAESVMEGVLWGEHYGLFTPAYWATMAWYDTFEERQIGYRIGKSLQEEMAACILGGYGIPAEVGWAAFYRIRDAGLLEVSPSRPESFMQLLAEPLCVRGRNVRYRFARQKAEYLSSALNTLRTAPPPAGDDMTLRKWLLGLKGVGPKTASWITRNWLQSDNVAIIDIHIHRAGLLMGLYSSGDTPANNYFTMEAKFLEFAGRIKVKASVLDALIWCEMKLAGQMVQRLLEEAGPLE